ncbi:(2Fe-2S)-binding protein [Paracoccus sp. 1_MG-2023]|uniref:(2Fe-2S)-binding protein n=1 Tax=unclassified Paracoccus (in: a-proteobacteria) TaxID=2688777 RepID=UPI001C08D1FC|nr:MULTISPECIES: (2Fe-2S)-binding protein [unclassified Paracoccus (in: a-proteobacteria)]MBU2958238.1 (2Fe-2S)-binding protein [Paracoccus sp. C2R09]MDO6668365.1 (2Fe-2S)-binding protein [Paracoccus sp. 1_MG-2023]
MIVCHCTQISDRDIRAAIDWMREADPQTIITPGKIYHALGKRADCGGCMPLFLDTMRACDKVGVAPPILRPRTDKDKERSHEGRPQGHRISQRRASV